MRKTKRKGKIASRSLAMTETRYHYTEQYLLNPQHPVTINLVGCGGTGSQVLSILARMHTSLRALGHPGFHVMVWDGDTVTEANVGRQMFSTADIGLNKGTVLVSRINRYFGLGWECTGRNWNKPNPSEYANITITCVDTVKVRRAVYEGLLKQRKRLTTPPRSITMQYLPDVPEIPFYWLDFGNGATFGQAIIGTCHEIRQPSKTNGISILPMVFDIFPKLEKHEAKDTGPSCSLAEALDKQDLFINSTLAQLGCNILWKLFRNARIEHHGLFLNLATMAVNPILI